jgi:hypothetical protein
VESFDFKDLTAISFRAFQHCGVFDPKGLNPAAPPDSLEKAVPRESMRTNPNSPQAGRRSFPGGFEKGRRGLFRF